MFPCTKCWLASTYHATGFWLPILARTVAKVTGVTDYNIVQNNGKYNYLPESHASHSILIIVHFRIMYHCIPRYIDADYYKEHVLHKWFHMCTST